MHGIMELDEGAVWGSTWHGIESYKTQDFPVSIEEATRILDYPLDKRQLYLEDGREVGAWAIVRADTNAVLCPSVGRDFTTMNNAHMVKFVSDEILSKFPELEIESVGTLFNGATAFLNIKMNEFQVKGDKSPTMNRLMYCNPIGRGSYKACAHGIRIVCNNTLRASEAEGAANKTLKRIPHTRNAAEGIRNHLVELAEVKLGLQKYQAKLEHLTTLAVDVEYVNDFVVKLFPADEESQRSMTMAENKREKLLNIFNSDQDLEPGVANSRYGLLQAVTYYYDHDKPGSNADQTAIQWDGLVGSRANIKELAFNSLLTA